MALTLNRLYTQEVKMNSSQTRQTDRQIKDKNASNDFLKPWPVDFDRRFIRWFPAETRLLGRAKANIDSFVLPPSVVRKAAWRD